MAIDRIHDTTSIDNATAFIIHRTARLLRVQLQKKLQAVGLNVTPEQWFILFRLMEKPGQAQSALADDYLADHPNITRQVDGLVKRGLARRMPDPDDRRRSLIFLTDEGIAAMEKVKPHIVQIRLETFASFDEEETEQFVMMLEKLQRNITNT